MAEPEKTQTQTIGSAISPEERELFVNAARFLETETSLADSLRQAKALLNAMILEGRPAAEISLLSTEASSALERYRVHLTTHKSDYLRRALDVNTCVEFLHRFKLITGQGLTPREIADTRGSPGMLALQDLRLSFDGNDISSIRDLAERVNQSARDALASGKDTDVNLIISTTNNRSASYLEAMAKLVDEWWTNPDVQTAICGLEDADQSERSPALMWKMSAKRAFMNADLIRSELANHLPVEQRDSFVGLLARVLGTDNAAARARLEAFEVEFDLASEEVDAYEARDPFSIDGATSAVKERFNGISIEEATRTTRQLTNALRAYRAEIGDRRGFPKQLGFTVRAGEHVEEIDPFVLLRRVEQAIALGADRIGHGLILVIDRCELLMMGKLKPADVARFELERKMILARLKQAGVTIELNLASYTNGRLQGTTLAARDLVMDGLRVSISTADPTTVREQLHLLAAQPGTTRTDIATVILEGYYSRLGQRTLTCRASLKRQLRETLLSSQTSDEAVALSQALAGRFLIHATSNPAATIQKVLDVVFGMCPN